MGRYPVVFDTRRSSGQLPLCTLDELGDQLIDPATGQPYISVPGSGRLTWGAAPPSDPLETYDEGDARFNTDPATNQSVAGWVCSTGGVGGVAVWTPFYLVYGTPVDRFAVTWDAVEQQARWAEVGSGGGEEVLDEGEESEVRSLIAAAVDESDARLYGEVGRIDGEFRKLIPDDDSYLERKIAEVADAASAQLCDEVGRINGEFRKLIPDDDSYPERKIAEVADTASSQLYDAVGRIDGEFKKLQPDDDSYLEGMIAEAADVANARLHDEVGRLYGALNQQALVVEDLRPAIEVAADAADAALDSATTTLNERIGKQYVATTPGATPTVVATITPSPFRATRLYGKVVAHRLDHLEAAIYNFVALARAVPASDVLTLAVGVPPVGVPTAGEMVTVGAKVYTWQDVLAAAYDVLIGADNEVSIDNLVKAVNLTGIAGVNYGIDTAKNPVASAVKASVALPVATMEAVALTPGLAGNTIATTTTMANGVWGGVGTMAGGSDMSLFGKVRTVEYEDDAAWDADIAAVGANVEVTVTGVAGTPIKWLVEATTLELF